MNEQVYQQMHDLGGLAEKVRKASSQALHGTGLQLSEHVQGMSALAQNFVRAAAADDERRP